MATDYRTPQEAKDVVFDRLGDKTIEGKRPDKKDGIEGYCATYVYRMAYYITHGVYKDVGGAAYPREGFLNPNNDGGCNYSNALINLGYNIINHAIKNRSELIQYCANNSSFSNGDIVNYWHIDEMNASCWRYGHTQMYIGGGIWESSYKNNYQASFVYGTKGNANDKWFFQHLRLNGVPAYNLNMCSIGETSIPTGSGDEKIEKMSKTVMARAIKCVRWLVNSGLGLNEVQACGVVGNLVHESGGINPTCENSEGAYGIAQWHPGGGRKQNLISFCNQNGLDYKTLYAQLEFLKNELTTKPSLGLSQLRSATNYTDATNVFCDNFERPGPDPKGRPKRRGYAHQIYDALHS